METLNDHLPLSPDHNAERLAALKKLLPDLFSNDGRLNVDELKKVVDPALVSETERYDFRWYGKTKSKREAFTPSRAALVYDPVRSVNPEKAGGNMIIEGENLEVLKLLTSAYRERIKCIYIDGPYNTGKDFVYSDNFAEGQKPYWEQTGVTEGGVKVDTNTESEGRFHSNWLSMMHSRLLVARYLLRPDGAIFLSIDEHEVHALKRLMDEVFGEEAFIADVAVVNNLKGRNDKANIATAHEHLLIYAKPEFQTYGLPLTEKQIAEYGEADDDGEAFQWRDLRKRGGADSREERPSLFYPVYADPKSGEVRLERASQHDVEIFPKRSDESDGCWRWAKDRVLKNLANIKAFKVDGKNRWNVSYRVFLQSNGKMRVAKPKSVWLGSQYSTDAATRALRSLIEDVDEITPKPVGFLQAIIYQAMEDDDLILDFFGGSGTTSQAVMELNKADGGNRQFILVQLPELTAEDSQAFKAGFKRISDITIERAKRVVQKFKTEAEGLLPNDPQRQFADSLGFKVYRLAKSAFPRVEFAPDPAKTEAENIELLKQYIREKEATFHLQFEKDKVLDEVLLKNGFMLDYTLTRQPEFKKNEVFLAKDAYKESLVCLDAKLEPETVDHFKTHKDQFFICLELALDTTKKWNLKHNLGEKLKAI
jgi:adenine-specific DNA-methyltransferase